MENKIVVGNMKMNKLPQEIDQYLEQMSDIHSQSVIICPTSIYLEKFKGVSFQVGIQNTAPARKGAYTGEVSPQQAYEMGARYTILGHSERRQIFHEDNTLIYKKIVKALQCQLKVILCIGETQEERQLLRTNMVLKRQLLDVLTELSREQLQNIIIAYEPIWAIGTNEIPSNKEISDTISYIRNIVKLNCHYEDIPVLYGGSINDKNIEQLNTITNVSGFLVGGACLEPKQFKYIIEVAVPR